MKKLGFGAMRFPLTNPDDIRSIDLARVREMVDLFMQSGFTYFDTAYPYHGGQSEVALREVLVKRYPRDAFTITDKMPMFNRPTADEMPKIFAEQLERCGVSYFDYYWLHALDQERINFCEEQDAFGFLRRLKEEGKARHIGFSFHDTADVLDKLLTAHPEAEYVQLQINYLDWESETVQARQCYEVCCKHGKPVIVMEPIKGGSLANLPEEAASLLKRHAPDASVASWAIRYAASLEQVMVVLSGMSTLEQVQDNVGYMRDFRPLDAQEHALIAQVTAHIRQFDTIPCTACGYCTAGCPMAIPIPDIFKLYNRLKRYTTTLDHARAEYRKLRAHGGAAISCVMCRQCEGVCPQHLPIMEKLQIAADLFDD